jgi:hypothetical protein
MSLFSTISILPIPRWQAQMLVKAQKQFLKEESNGWVVT